MLRSYVKGALSFILPSARNSHADIFPVSAEFSYSQFLRHLILRNPVKPLRPGETVAELGPGSSLGFGLAALISGAARYRAYDVAAHFDAAANVRIFDDLVALFRRQAPVPDTGEFARIFPFVEDSAFPAALFAGKLSEALADDRLAQIRDDIARGGGETVGIVIGKSAGDGLKADWLASHSVLEHAEPLEDIYQLMRTVMKPDGVMTHLIDFSSHNLTRAWNGHWALGDRTWSVLRGRRTYLINREPLSTHLKLMQRSNFAVTEQRLHRRVDGYIPPEFTSGWTSMDMEDGRTHMAFLVCAPKDQQDAAPP